MDSVGPIAVGVVTVTLSGFVMRALIRGQRKKADAIRDLLKTRGPLTLDELATATRTGLIMKGYLMQALDGMASKGELTKIPPPHGHPALRIARDTKYGLPSAAGAQPG